MNTAHERAASAARNIMSGKNACGSLAAAVRSGDTEYFLRMIRPLAEVYEQEADELRRQRDEALRDAETKRFALESVLSNIPVPAGPVHDAIRRAMPAHPLLGGA